MVKAKGQQGLTLVELMVAITLSLIIIAGIIQLFISSKETYRINDLISQIQESGRFAVDSLAHELRMAGYQGCVNPKAIAPVNIVLNSPPAPAFKQTAILGTEGVGNPDSVLVQYGSADNSPLVSASDPVNAVLTIDNNDQGFAVGEVIMVADCSSAHLVRITAIAASGTNTALTYGSDENNLALLLKSYAKDVTRVMKLNSVRFTVADTGRKNGAGSPVMGLFRKGLDDAQPVELVEGVENMQVLFAERLSDGSLRYAQANDATLNWSRVSSVRLGLLLQTTELAGDRVDKNNYVLAGTTVEPSTGTGTVTHAVDRRFRRAFNVTVYLRNRE